MSAERQLPPLFEFAYCPRFPETLNGLAKLAMKENWNFSTEDPERPLPILFNYIQHTFKRLLEEYNELQPEEKDTKICIVGEKGCFNTGLFTENYEPIFCVFNKNRFKDQQPWCLWGFFSESERILEDFSCLPQRAKFFKDISELIYDYRLDIRIKISHIIEDENNFNRLPTIIKEKGRRRQLVQDIEGAVQIAKKMVSANYRLAVPQFYESKVQLLIPLYFGDSDEAVLALPISKGRDFYTGHTCLTLEMAYNNARLIAKPGNEWLVTKG